MKKIYMKEGFIIMNLSKHKRWRAHSDCKTIKTYPVCLYAAEKYEKVEIPSYKSKPILTDI